MAPVKFDDISKTANTVLSDDYQVSGYQLQAKQTTSFHGAVITTAVDLLPGKDMVTPAKLTWKLPKPLGCPMFSIDKLEMDKAGKLKLEASSEKVYKGLRVDAKSDLADPAKITASAVFTGLADTQIKIETKPLKPQDFNFEVTRSEGIATFGIKGTAATLTSPDVGVCLLSGPFFCSLLATEKLSVFTGHAFYKASGDLKFAATYEQGGKKNGSFSVGLLYSAMAGTTVRAKVAQDQSVSVGVKYEVSKGLTCLVGGKYEAKGLSYGLKLSIE